MLGKDANEPVTYAELETITEIYIYGDTPTVSQTNDMIQNGGGLENLEDFNAMINLRILVLSNQTVSDISPLAENTQLTHLTLLLPHV